MENQIIQWITDYWHYFTATIILPVFSKRFRNWFWGKWDHLKQVWHSPERTDKLEEKIDSLSQDHKDAAKERQKNKEESDEKLNKLDNKIERILGHLEGPEK